MKKRIAASLATIALASTLVGGATFALFTDASTNANNQFTAGTIKVKANDVVQTSGLNVSNLAPGDVYSGTFSVQNTGSLQERITVTPNKDGGNLWNDAAIAVGTFDNVLDPGEEITVPFTVNYSLAATVQEATGVFNFTVDAVQTANN